jgi:hypothetical protein
MGRTLSFGFLGLVLLVVLGSGSGCATSTQTGTGGMGGSATSTSTGGEGGVDSGLPPGTCILAADCMDMGDPCNEAACVNGMCGKLPAHDGAKCDDGLFCTEDDTCKTGVCVGMTQKQCPGADGCNVGACDEASKTCATTPGNDGQSCPSPSICLTMTTCSNGVCGGGLMKDCTVFDDLCALGVCDPAVGCKPQQKNDGMPCDSGQMDPCFDATCVGGICQKMPKNDGAVCDPGLGNPCIVGSCLAGTCMPQPANEGMVCDPGNFNPCETGACAMGTCVPGPANDGTVCDDFLFCTINDHCAMGACTGDPNPCGPGNGCFINQCDEFSQTCQSVPGNNGSMCDDGNACTQGTTCSNGVCGNGSPTNEGGPCIASSCTVGDFCTNGMCGGGVGPPIYFSDDFHDASKGWILGNEWQIGPAMMSNGGVLGADPAVDHTNTADNGVAGVVIGGNENPILHPMAYLESPAFDTSAAAGSVIFGYYRWLNSDYDPFMHNHVEVFDGTKWIVLWQSGGPPSVEDSPPTGMGWTYFSYDVTQYKNAGMKVRFGFDVTMGGVFTIGSWNVDDVLVAGAACP